MFWKIVHEMKQILLKTTSISTVMAQVYFAAFTHFFLDFRPTASHKWFVSMISYYHVMDKSSFKSAEVVIGATRFHQFGNKKIIQTSVVQNTYFIICHSF